MFKEPQPLYRGQTQYDFVENNRQKPPSLNLFDESSLASMFESKSNTILGNGNLLSPRGFQSFRSYGYNQSPSRMYGDDEMYRPNVPNLMISKSPRLLTEPEPLTSRSYLFMKERRQRISDYY